MRVNNREESKWAQRSPLDKITIIATVVSALYFLGQIIRVLINQN